MRLFSLLCIMLFCLTGCDVRTDVERAEAEGILIVGNNAEPQSFDPHIATAVSDFKIINAVMEGLLRGDSADDAKYHPGVAESWTHNASADKWVFKLRKDVVWSDGHPLTAHDFVYAYHRLLHPEFGGRYADMLYPLKNAERYNRNRRSEILGDCPDSPDDGKTDLWEKANVGVRAPDDHTLELELNSPMPQLPLMLLHCTWFPVPRHAIEARGGMLNRSGAWTRPGVAVGNGPFIMAEHRFNDYVEVRKNPRYRRANEVKLNGVRFLPIVNGFTETRMFLDDKIHITNNVPPEMTAYAALKCGDAFCRDDYYATTFYRMNTAGKPLDDERVRRALSMAIDRAALVRDVARGAGVPCFGFTPNGAGYETPHGVEFNPEKARQLLAEAGYPEGEGFPNLEITTTSREVQKIIAEAIQGMWKDNLGIHVDIRSCEWTAYKYAQNTMQYDFSASSWSGDYLDSSSFLDLWGTNAGNNNTGWSNADYDRLLTAARQTGNQQERMKLLAEAEKLMLEEAPVIPLYWSIRSYLKRPEVQGWHPLLLDNHLFEDVYFKHPTEKGAKP